MGTGKSKTCLDELGELADTGVIDRVLIVAGKGSYADWGHEHIPTHWDEDSIPTLWHIWNGGKPKELRTIDWMLSAQGQGVKFLIMNIEALSSSDKAFKVAYHFCSSGKVAIVIDEASKIKNRTSERTKALLALGKKAVIRRILTGSPVTQSPLDLWSQCEFLQKGLLKYSNFMSFRAHFAVLEPIYLGKRKVERVVEYRNLNELEGMIEPFSFRVMKEDCLDLPPKIYRKYNVEMTDEQQQKYDDMKRFSVTELEGGKFASAQLAISRLSKLHQIVCGHITTEEGEVVTLKTKRVDALMDVVSESAGGPVLVWCAFRHDVEVVCRELRKAYGFNRVVEYHGGTSPEDRAAAIAAIQGGEADYFVATQATGGYGITLTRSQTSIYYSNSFNLEYRLQSEDRNHRIGQKGSVTYTDLCCSGTIDEQVITALRGKKDIAHLVMGDGVREWLK